NLGHDPPHYHLTRDAAIGTLNLGAPAPSSSSTVGTAPVRPRVIAFSFPTPGPQRLRGPHDRFANHPSWSSTLMSKCLAMNVTTPAVVRASWPPVCSTWRYTG